MTLQEKIKADMIQSMKDKSADKTNVLRGLLSAFTSELMNKGKKPDEAISDEGATTVIMRAVKQRKDSIDQFTKGGRADLATSETAELAIIEGYAPKLMAVEEITALAQAKKAELGITDKSKMGQLMSALMKDLKGKADGADVKKAVEGLF